MATQVDTRREILLVESARIRPTMGIKFSATSAQRGTRFMLIAGRPYGEIPIFNISYVD